MKRRRALMNEDASMVCVISRWRARVTRQVNKHPHRFVVLLLTLTWNGPKKSTPVNGVSLDWEGSRTEGWQKARPLAGLFSALSGARRAPALSIRMVASSQFCGDGESPSRYSRAARQLRSHLLTNTNTLALNHLAMISAVKDGTNYGLRWFGGCNRGDNLRLSLDLGVVSGWIGRNVLDGPRDLVLVQEGRPS